MAADGERGNVLNNNSKVLVMAKITCDDSTLKEVLSKFLTENMKKFERLSLLTENLWSLSIYDQTPEFTSIVKLDPKDQLLINRILCEMIINGELIINLFGDTCKDIEVAWAGEKTPISD
jgi:hypothetical protein